MFSNKTSVIVPRLSQEETAPFLILSHEKKTDIEEDLKLSQEIKAILPTLSQENIKKFTQSQLQKPDALKIKMKALMRKETKKLSIDESFC